MARSKPGEFNRFRGLWVRGSVDNTPTDHFSASQNNQFDSYGVRTRDGSESYLEQPNIIRKQLYKPNPPFAGTNVPRIIYLTSSGQLFDENYPGDALYTNVDMTDFALVNFFGRCYISPSNGKVGLDNDFIYVYNGTGSGGFRKAAGTAPTVAMTAHLPIPLLGDGNLGVGTYLFSYALETASGFITKPAPFVAIDVFGSGRVTVDVLPLGPAGTAARWIIGTRVIPFRANLSIPFDVSTANLYPQFLVERIGDNTTTTTTISYYDEQLAESADYLQTVLEEIPAGVGLMDFKGRMVSYGEYDNPSLLRASTIGEPEAYSSTSGFLTTDPADSTGIRSAIEFRNSLYFFKQQRGYVTQDNQEEPSTWEVVNFEKSLGAEQYCIAAILDAKGSSADGFIIGSRGALHYFNGVVQEPELSYKIRDLWSRISDSFFYRTQIAHDPINKRIFALLPLDGAEYPSHVLFGDYREGLDAINIKWDLWLFDDAPKSILIYNYFTNDNPTLVVKMADSNRIFTLTSNEKNDCGARIDSYFRTGPIKFDTYGLFTFTKLFINCVGPARLKITAYNRNLSKSFSREKSVIGSARDYEQKLNLANEEECILEIRQNTINQGYAINSFKLDGYKSSQGRVY